jgi:hypothetical protein
MRHDALIPFHTHTTTDPNLHIHTPHHWLIYFIFRYSRRLEKGGWRCEPLPRQDARGTQMGIHTYSRRLDCCYTALVTFVKKE